MLKPKLDEEKESYGEIKKFQGKKEGVVAGRILGLAEGKIVGFDKGEIAGIDKGKVIGNKIGKQEEKIEIVKEMLKENCNINMIMKVTKPIIEEIKKIENEMK